MGSLLSIINPTVETPKSMYDGHENQIPSAPVDPTEPTPSTVSDPTPSGSSQQPVQPHAQSSSTQRRQITVPPSENIEYIPAPQGQLLFDIEKSTFFLSPECELKVQQTNDLALALCCVRQHANCTTNPSLRVMLRDLGEKPTEKSLYFHLRLLHDDPSILPTVRKLLGKTL